LSQWVEQHIACPCGNSSDAYCIHKDGHGHCFSCNKTFKKEKMEQEETANFTYEYIARRGISRETHEFFKVRARVNADGVPTSVEYPYPNGATQVRLLDKKEFFSKGPMSQAAGWATDKFAAGSAKSITITEGNDDAMSAYEMLGKYPVYAVRSASTAVKDCRADYDYLNSFEKIYLCLDNDEPGHKAAQAVASIFGFNKVYHVKCAPYKDANEWLEAGKTREFRNIWFNAHRFLPEGIKSSFEQIDEILDRASKEPGVPWPFPTLTALTGGLKRGRAYLISGLEGIGKTELFHATEFCLANDVDPDANVAYLHFEEPPDDTVKKQAGYLLRTPTHTDDSPVALSEVKEAWRKLARRPDRLHIIEHFGSEDPDALLAQIRFLVAACGCKYVFLDNITVSVTGLGNEREREQLDYLSTQLEMLVKGLRFVLVVISHENDNEQTRGSRNISKVFDVWINMKRDIKNENEFLRRIIYLSIFKNRQNWKTGPAGRLIYDPETSTLSELTEALPT
jgi:twinkle protein